MNKVEVAVNIGYIEIEPCGVDSLISTLQKYKAEYDGCISLSPEGGYSGFDGYNARIEAESKKREDIERKEMKRLMNKKSLSPVEKSKLLKYIKDYM